MLSWWPTRELPEDTFGAACKKIDAALEEIRAESRLLEQPFVEKMKKSIFNSAIGFMVSSDEPVSFGYSCSTDPAE